MDILTIHQSPKEKEIVSVIRMLKAKEKAEFVSTKKMHFFLN
jgi:hypothetical protein